MRSFGRFRSPNTLLSNPEQKRAAKKKAQICAYYHDMFPMTVPKVWEQQQSSCGFSN
ncbi:hypothetical protein NBRC3293_0278 [Gluconobacter oxydans NBRC 3293]|uniref:Uncharacterized protein n=1 Tax=Gluconobacter oxydans NBRC 3293 TaxID=1315969 RepID=A0A829WXW9_GLUOY|nr:hypothetical protein NBRC3293_0278 [Gluconobacter oxydans NBRC 3293]